MDSAAAHDQRRELAAYTLPMVTFLGGLLLVSGLKKIGGPFWLSSAEYWVYPLQTCFCGSLVWLFRRSYRFHAARDLPFTVAIATGVFLLWIAPQAFFHSDPRLEGFNPDVFAAHPVAYWLTVAFRFLRLVVVVPLVEEIFWRGFLLRYLINERFMAVPLGAFSWISFSAVTLGFTFAHSSPDWPAAAVTGALYNCVAYRTKSLSSCVLAHALTNLLLGIWIMQTRQWGFW